MDYDVAKSMNLMASNNFMFELHNLPYVSMFAQNFDLPAITLGRVSQPTPLSDLALPGNKLEFTDLVLTFLVDENMKNYLEIWTWMNYLGAPIDTRQYKKIQEGKAAFPLVSDLSVHLLSNKLNPTKVIKFIDCYPVDLGGLSFRHNETESIHPECTVAFDYSYFTFVDDETMAGIS